MLHKILSFPKNSATLSSMGLIVTMYLFAWFKGFKCLKESFNEVWGTNFWKYKIKINLASFYFAVQLDETWCIPHVVVIISVVWFYYWKDTLDLGVLGKEVVKAEGRYKDKLKLDQKVSSQSKVASNLKKKGS